MQGKKEHFVDGATPPLPLPKLLASVLLPYYPTRNFDRLFILMLRGIRLTCFEPYFPPNFNRF